MDTVPGEIMYEGSGYSSPSKYQWYSHARVDYSVWKFNQVEQDRYRWNVYNRLENPSDHLRSVQSMSPSPLSNGFTDPFAAV